ncbi:hypothetical protein, partial [Methylobacterium sp. WL12]|uniref:hypothetical protein n=1 Tax=Methylobacterium sp. WL12 TaxID=2603890 RepID=UPI00165097B6
AVSAQKRPPRPQLPHIIDLATFAEVHYKANEVLTHYVDYPRVNALIPSAGVRLKLDLAEAIELPANNAHARIRFAHIAFRHITECRGIRCGPLCYVTITPAAFAKRLSDEAGITPDQCAQLRRTGPAAHFSIRRVQALARQALGTIPFVGMVEAVMYKGWGPNGQFYGDWISWHCHLITWGATHKQLTAALAPLRVKHNSMLPGNSAAHIAPFNFNQLEQKIAYTLKAPQKATRVVFYKNSWTNPATGEIRPVGFKQKKDWLRPGERVRMLDVLADHTLDKLLFGNGVGSPLANAIRSEALQPLRRDKIMSELYHRPLATNNGSRVGRGQSMRSPRTR